MSGMIDEFVAIVAKKLKQTPYSLLTYMYKCCLLITFANSLDPDQARHFVRPNLDPSRLTL